MEPIELNAGAWYLRATRPEDWGAGHRYAWDVCAQVDGTVVAETAVVPRPDGAVLESRAAPAGADSPGTAPPGEAALEEVLPAVERLARGALGCERITREALRG